MTYRKLKADYLFDGYKMAESGSVLICQSDGTIDGITDEAAAGEGVEEFAGMISPGFINCHCHLELSHLKGMIPEKQGLVSFLLSVITQRNQSASVKDSAAKAAEKEMFEAGIVAVGDISNTADTLQLKSAGRLKYYNFIELLGWAPEQAVGRLEAAKQLEELFGVPSSVSPHAPYSVSRELWQLMEPEFRSKTITIHNQESAAENEFFNKGTGDLTRLYSFLKMDISNFVAPKMNSPAHYLSHLKSAARILLVHNTFMEEYDLISATRFHENLFLCVCANANLYIENRLPDIPLFQKHHAKIVIGTDSLASNNHLSVLDELKTIRNAFPMVPSGDLLTWATSNGANALQLDEELGDFQQGKKPGILLIDAIEAGEITRISQVKRLV